MWNRGCDDNRRQLNWNKNLGFKEHKKSGVINWWSCGDIDKIWDDYNIKINVQ